MSNRGQVKAAVIMRDIRDSEDTGTVKTLTEKLSETPYSPFRVVPDRHKLDNSFLEIVDNVESRIIQTGQSVSTWFPNLPSPTMLDFLVEQELLERMRAADTLAHAMADANEAPKFGALEAQLERLKEKTAGVFSGTPSMPTDLSHYLH